MRAPLAITPTWRVRANARAMRFFRNPPSWLYVVNVIFLLNWIAMIPASPWWARLLQFVFPAWLLLHNIRGWLLLNGVRQETPDERRHRQAAAFDEEATHCPTCDEIGTVNEAGCTACGATRTQWRAARLRGRPS